MKLQQALLFLGLILGISICSASFPTLGGYQRIDAYEVQNSVEIQQFIDLGLQSVVQEAYSKGEIGTSTVSDYQLQKINSIYKQALDGENYKFDCEFKNAQNLVIKATFEVHYQRTTSITNIQTYSYDVKKEDIIQSVQDSYVQVDAQEVQYSAEIQSVLDYGVTDCVKKSIAAKQISDSKYEITVVNAVYKQVVESALFYKCDVDLKSENGNIIQATFTVYYHPFLNSLALIDYLCNEKVVVTDSGSTTITDSISTTASTQVQVNTNNKQQDALTNSLLQYGIDQILQKGIKSGKIPNTSFTLVEITSVSIQTSTKGKDSYKFKCILQNTKGSSVEMTFTVSYQTSSKQKTLSSWSYNIKTISQTTTTQIISPIEDQYTPLSEDEVYNDAIIESPMQYGIDEIIKIGNSKNKIPKDKYQIEELIEAYSQVVGNWVFYKFTCTLRNAKGNVSIRATFTVNYQIATTKKKLTEYSYNVRKESTVTTTQTTTTTNTTQSVEGQYVQCTQEEINNDWTIQDVLKYATQQIYLRGVQDKKIPESKFEITTVNSVSKQVVQNKGTFYKCDLVLDNSIGSTLTMTFTVLYHAKSQQKSLSQWSYHISTKNIVKPTSTEQGSYVNVDISTVQTNSVIQGSLNYGIDQILQTAVKDRKINDVNYDITKVISISKKSSGANTYYKCQVELSNTYGSVINMNFNVYYETKTKKKTLKSYSYDIKTVSKVVQPIDIAYITVSQSEIDHSSDIKTCLDYGINQIIPSPQGYSIKTINDVQRQIADSALYYKFDVDLTNDMGSTEISFKFTVFYKAETGERFIKAYSYKTKSKTTITTTSNVSYKYSKVAISKVQSNSKYQSIINSGVKDCLINLYDKQVIATQDFTISEIVSFSQQITSSEKYRCRAKLTNAAGIYLEVSFEVNVKSDGYQSLSSYSVEGYTSTNKGQALVVDSGVYDNYGMVVGSYDKLESTEINNDSEVKACIDYGVKESVKKIVKKEKYSVKDFKVKEIKSVCRDSVNKDIYRVESTLVNSKGAIIDCSFLVKNQSGTGDKQLSSYTYTAY